MTLVGVEGCVGVRICVIEIKSLILRSKQRLLIKSRRMKKYIKALGVEYLADAVTDEFGVKYSPDGTRLLKAPQDLRGSYTIKPGTKDIRCCAFSWCSSLASITIPDGVTSIGHGAFWLCSSLASVTIPDSVTSIGDDAFGGCSLLESITIPASVKEFKGTPFCNWNGELVNKSPFFVYEDGVLFSKNKDQLIAFRRQDVTSYVIPDSVTSIGDNAFYGSSALTSVTIPTYRRRCFFEVSVIDEHCNPRKCEEHREECFLWLFVVDEHQHSRRCDVHRRSYFCLV